MRAELGLPSVKGDDEHGGGMTGGFGGSMGGAGQSNKSKRPISVKFEIPYFTTSGIQVRYLKIIEPKVSENKPFLAGELFSFSNSMSIFGYMHDFQSIASHYWCDRCGYFPNKRTLARHPRVQLHMLTQPMYLVITSKACALTESFKCYFPFGIANLF